MKPVIHIILLIAGFFPSLLASEPVYASFDHLSDFDAIRFFYQRANEGDVEVVIRKPRTAGGNSEVVSIVTTIDGKTGLKNRPIWTTRTISAKSFMDLVTQLCDQAVVKRSIAQVSDDSIHGSLWLLELQKNDFRIGHVRNSPTIDSDRQFRLIGEKILQFGGVDIAKDKLL